MNSSNQIFLHQITSRTLELDLKRVNMVISISTLTLHLLQIKMIDMHNI